MGVCPRVASALRFLYHVHISIFIMLTHMCSPRFYTVIIIISFTCTYIRWVARATLHFVCLCVWHYHSQLRCSTSARQTTSWAGNLARRKPRKHINWASLYALLFFYKFPQRLFQSEEYSRHVDGKEHCSQVIKLIKPKDLPRLTHFIIRHFMYVLLEGKKVRFFIFLRWGW